MGCTGSSIDKVHKANIKKDPSTPINNNNEKSNDQQLKSSNNLRVSNKSHKLDQSQTFGNIVKNQLDNQVLRMKIEDSGGNISSQTVDNSSNKAGGFLAGSDHQELTKQKLSSDGMNLKTETKFSSGCTINKNTNAPPIDIQTIEIINPEESHTNSERPHISKTSDNINTTHLALVSNRYSKASFGDSSNYLIVPPQTQIANLNVTFSWIQEVARQDYEVSYQLMKVPNIELKLT